LKEAAAYFNRSPPMLTRWKNSGRYKGFYTDADGKPKVFLPELIESYRAVGIDDNKNGGGDGDDDEAEMRRLAKQEARAKARTAIRKDQREDGKTVYIPDIVMGWDEVASKFRTEHKALAPLLAKQAFEFMSQAMLEDVADDPDKVEAVAEVMQRFDIRPFAIMIAKTMDENLGDFGDMIADLIPQAMEKSRNS